MPIDPETMAPLAMESCAPHRNDFQPANIGKPIYYGLRWLNSKGEAGPWSPIYSANVPG